MASAELSDAVLWLGSPARSDLARQDCVLLDLDHTIARYRLRTLGRAIYESIFDALPESFRRSKKGYDHQAQQKGLVFDVASGLVLKLDAHGRVDRASRGRRQLTPGEIVEHFGKTRTWDGFDLLRSREKHPSFLAFVTYFDAPAVLVIQDLVAAVDAGELTPEAAADTQGADSSFDKTSGKERNDAVQRAQEAIGGGAASASGGDPTAGTGSDEAGPGDSKPRRSYDWLLPPLFRAFFAVFDNIGALGAPRHRFMTGMQARPEDFLFARPHVREMLLDLRRRGVFVVLATNSHFRYARLLLRFCLGERYCECFDSMLFDTGKGGWFAKVRPFKVMADDGWRTGRRAVRLPRTVHSPLPPARAGALGRGLGWGLGGQSELRARLGEEARAAAELVRFCREQKQGGEERSPDELREEPGPGGELLAVAESRDVLLEGSAAAVQVLLDSLKWGAGAGAGAGAGHDGADDFTSGVPPSERGTLRGRLAARGRGVRMDGTGHVVSGAVLPPVAAGSGVVSGGAGRSTLRVLASEEAPGRAAGSASVGEKMKMKMKIQGTGGEVPRDRPLVVPSAGRQVTVTDPIEEQGAIPGSRSGSGPGSAGDRGAHDSGVVEGVLGADEGGTGAGASAGGEAYHGLTAAEADEAAGSKRRSALQSVPGVAGPSLSPPGADAGAETPGSVSASQFARRQHARCMYVGDHLHGDSAAARAHMGWSTGTVCEELQGAGLSQARRAWDALQRDAPECALQAVGGIRADSLTLWQGRSVPRASSSSSSHAVGSGSFDEVPGDVVRQDSVDQEVEQPCQGKGGSSSGSRTAVSGRAGDAGSGGSRSSGSVWQGSTPPALQMSSLSGAVGPQDLPGGGSSCLEGLGVEMGPGEGDGAGDRRDGDVGGEAAAGKETSPWGSFWLARDAREWEAEAEGEEREEGEEAVATAVGEGEADSGGTGTGDQDRASYFGMLALGASDLLVSDVATFAHCR